MPPVIERPKLPEELTHLNPELFKILFPDLTVTVDPRADRTSSHMATFTVILSPGAIASTGYAYPAIIIEDLSLPVADRVVWEIQGLRMKRQGDSKTLTAEWDMPPDAVFNPDFHNELRITVDPYKAIGERQEGNNSVTFWGTTIG